ncbi:Adenine nucleotide alpha hydrolases-like superfamily protein isoform 1 [Hibiscus syriacus]|uniref:Adenine nucleotide alpha hydrolases-like superfamily protein isoform 1 n=1 Tax=Hibiscus syriacus TaxID=106335 RepID=A0A6A3BA26_HIBSY|nr:uncharacterized protein LOC120113629 isoform X2 [Hibiscus syriacus]KAE8713233.1 Adenine nucleotide alpha hydrolases-like superfamily protein isoform 1 [Hibiscus syriacus]
MAEVLDDGEFWLPPRFLADDDLFMEKSKINNSHDSLFPYDLPSDLSSPVESVLGSTETDSDEEHFLVGLTRQMARYTLQDDFGGNHPAFSSKISKDWVLSSSPESTLCEFSSNNHSRISSPPGTWTLLCSAAEIAARVPVNEESNGGFINKGLLGPPAEKPSPNLHQSLSSRATQFQQVDQTQLMKRQHNVQVWGGKKQRHQQHAVLQNSVRGGNGTNRPTAVFPLAWAPLLQPQPRNGAGVGAVFLGNPTAKRECAGTGVFLPRRSGTAGPRKKQVCPVLVPARVVQALNLNLDEINTQPHLLSGLNASVATGSGGGSRFRSRGNDFAKQNKFRQKQVISREIRLPQEWTY